jgi:predicted GNAT family N-acyltransferase
VPFYEKLGFRIEGDVFDEAGISHVRMKHALE